MRSMLATLLISTLGAMPLAHATEPLAFHEVFDDIKPDQPGCAAGVMRGAKTIWSAGYGAADLATGRAIQADTLFNLASVSKQFTGFAILELEAQGRLDLDDSIRRFVPELPAYAEGIQIRHLLHHTSGLQDYMLLAELAGIPLTQRFTQQQALDLLFKQNALMFPPGSEFSYSNSGYVLLSSIAERAAGMPLKDYSRAHLFEPLGMSRSSIVDQYPVQLPNLAQGYEQDEPSKGPEAVDARWEQTGDGQVHSTVADLMLWLRNLSTGRVGGTALVEKMRQTEPFNDGDPGYYGMGLANRSYRGLQEVSHSGSWAGFSTDVAWYPKLDVATVVLCNSTEGEASERGHRLLDVLLGPSWLPRDTGIPAPPPSIKAVPKAFLNTLVAGTYLDDLGHQFQLQRTGKGFVLDTFHEVLPLLRQSDQLMVADNDGIPIYLAAAPGARIVSNNPASTYVLASAWKPEDIRRYVGLYALQTSPGQLKVYPWQGKLYVRIGQHSYPLQPLTTERFRAGELGVISFAEEGAVLTSSVARNLRFRKVTGQ
ncbi:beta-lactamase family protein [Pseudomonas sp. TNT2022 ID1048]|uniref:serine hydrolase domain-containing protein n=1 Tax=Pseudomonas idahonensis TaxID=2942628 RepID=UPI002362E502|nr:serine hydrolase domain-containing protein [Pseudomonas idahonensis]MDD1018236.1 beta-lactamase family protein [Pseudomonas idahonensis]